ncbi:unnamed protein product [Ilex paraguariensis]|uniref:Uncharacterized protein n=1 Tax=Ilex paraguariensis TaxID=185542 RepID=A0ABC8TTW3_9AQUA
MPPTLHGEYLRYTDFPRWIFVDELKLSSSSLTKLSQSSITPLIIVASTSSSGHLGPIGLGSSLVDSSSHIPSFSSTSSPQVGYLKIVLPFSLSLPNCHITNTSVSTHPMTNRSKSRRSPYPICSLASLALSSSPSHLLTVIEIMLSQ